MVLLYTWYNLCIAWLYIYILFYPVCLLDANIRLWDIRSPTQTASIRLKSVASSVRWPRVRIYKVHISLVISI